MGGADPEHIRQLSLAVNTLQVEVASLQKAITEYVLKAEFLPVKIIVYGLVAGCLGAVMTALINKVVVG